MANILIAEDERDIRELITYSLEFGGFSVTAAKDGKEALELAEREEFDLILMDVRMPGMSGYDACLLLKQSTKTRNVPVVFLSAKGQDSEVNRGLEVGAVDYILKPFAPVKLAGRVSEILARHGKDVSGAKG